MIYWPFDSVVSTDGQGNETYDRSFNSEQLRMIFSLLYTSGVVMTSDSNALKVSAATGMGVYVAPGGCIIQGAMGYENEQVYLDVPDAGALPRIDSVVARLNTNLSARDISIVYLQGTAASSPSAPVLTRNGGIYDLRLANIRVLAGATSITTANISDTRLSSDCGVATAVPQIINTNGIFNQYQAALNDFLEYADSCIEETIAGRLQAEIDDLNDESIEGSLAYKVRQVQSYAEAVIDSVHDAISELNIKPGDQITWTGCAAAFVTDNKKSVYFQIPFDRKIDPSVTNITLLSSNVKACYGGVFWVGSSSQFKPLTSSILYKGLTGTISDTGSVLIKLSFSALPDAVGNNRLATIMGTLTLGFE